MKVNEEGEIEDRADQPQDDALLEMIRQHIVKTYTPVESYGEADVRLTTHEIYEQLQNFYPGLYTQAIIAGWLQEAGFKFYDGGNLKLEWMLKKVV
jgi:hypothetical protein